jgi:hypothetical protein
MSHLKARPLSSKRLKKSTDSSNPLTFQQYNNYINIDTSKNNITIDEVPKKKYNNNKEQYYKRKNCSFENVQYKTPNKNKNKTKIDFQFAKHFFLFSS